MGVCLLVWLQLNLGIEGSVGVIQRIAVARRGLPLGEIFQRKPSAPRPPGFQGFAGLSLRYFYKPRRFIEVVPGGRFFILQSEGLRETHLWANLPLRWGFRLDTTSRPGWFWGGFSASLLLRAQSQPKVGGVYRFADYFNRSQLHLHLGLEKYISQRLVLGLQLSGDISPAWDKVLFQASRTLARHIWVSLYGQYRLWELR
ncbi:MAG: hypothetical protein NZ958_07595 [Bacteroidia bacterium]|nr:hypothetical protein [Bacteroidia bacterium]MDW8088654.1 hypothetical protein [Bacteroidia bacterium]